MDLGEPLAGLRQQGMRYLVQRCVGTRDGLPEVLAQASPAWAWRVGASLVAFLHAADLWVPKTYATWVDVLRGRGSVSFPCPAAGRLGKGWDDLRLVGLKLIFLIVSRAVSLLGLSRRESWWKDAEILMLRHQLTVAERERPGARARLTWPDRAWLALLAGTVPAERLAAMRLIVTPGTLAREGQCSCATNASAGSGDEADLPG
jgi:hypothetical protein